MGAVKIILHPVYVVKISTLRMGCSKKDFTKNKTFKRASKGTKKFNHTARSFVKLFQVFEWVFRTEKNLWDFVRI